MDKVKIKINKGAIKVNEAFYLVKTDKVVCVQIDMSSKYVEVEGYAVSDCPSIFLGNNEETLNIDESKKGTFTEITFTEYDNTWYIFATKSARYTVNVVLIKEDKNE